MKPVHYIILALLAAIGLMWFFWPSNKPDYSLHEARIAQREQAISELQQDYEKERQRRLKDSVFYMKSIFAIQSHVRLQSTVISDLKKNPRVIKVREEVPIIDSLIVAYDSLIEFKDQQINLQEKYVSTLQMDVNELTHNFEERLKLQSETIEDLNSIVDDQRKTIRKERRAKRLAKVVAIAGTIGAFVLGSQL